MKDFTDYPEVVRFCLARPQTTFVLKSGVKHEHQGGTIPFGLDEVKYIGFVTASGWMGEFYIEDHEVGSDVVVDGWLCILHRLWGRMNIGIAIREADGLESIGWPYIVE